MKLPLYQVDAFTDRVFGGNPAAVVLLERWLPDAVQQAIALENNLSETAFVVREPSAGPAHWSIRWCTPTTEVKLCGHATLAAAQVILTHLAKGSSEVHFLTRWAGPLKVTRDGARLALDFPVRPPTRISDAAAIGGASRALWPETRDVRELWRSAEDWMAVVDSAADVRALQPNMGRLLSLGQREGVRGLIVTAAGDDCDFVSRFFAPYAGVDEDPVTGSAHCVLIPYWALRLGKADMFARQISKRGGELRCALRGERVAIAGHAVEYLAGTIEVPG